MTPRIWLSIATFALCVGFASATSAAPNTPPADGLYESWSPISRRPVGRLSEATAKKLLPRWLSVRTRGQVSVVSFMPANRVRWQVNWGPQGIASKTTTVDGERFSTSRFIYREGRIREKQVELLGKRWSVHYRSDAKGRLIDRRETPPRKRGYRAIAPFRWTVHWAAKKVVIERLVGPLLTRRDTLDREGRTLLVELVFVGRDAKHKRPSMSLRFLRDRSGRLLRVVRRLDGLSRTADPFKPEPALAPRHLRYFHHNALTVERHEALLLLGAPRTASDVGRGVKRRITDHYAPTCWLNQPSGLRYDAAGLLVDGVVSCICGLCVDARLPIRASDQTGVDRHWTRGPWIRLDGRIDVTADHRVITPNGPRRADQLRAGDLVLDADGKPHRLRSVLRLPIGPLRLGRNVRTSSGVFRAGGLLFESEKPRLCAPTLR